MKKLIPWACVLVAMLACKKPFTPTLVTDNTRFLVVEGVITGNDSTIVHLSRSKKVDTLRTVFPESNAVVNIESDAGSSFGLTEIKAGEYAVGVLNLDAAHKYRLSVKTADGKKYVSDFVVLKNSPAIDSVGFVAKPEGLQIYVNAHDNASKTRYYRWDYTETWQFHAQYHSAYYSNGMGFQARTVAQQVYSCFGNDTSSTIVIASTAKLANDIIYQAPITTIASTSEKIEQKYSILVKQYALTSDAYSFWQNLQKNTQNLGSIFDVLPSQTQTNFHCVSNPNELVIGYLSAGNIAYKRIFITPDQLLSTYSPIYPSVCVLDTAFQNPAAGPPPQKGEDILVPAASIYMPVRGLYLPPPNINGSPTAYTFSTRICSDCTLRGKTSPPPFWR